jgi:Helitron helicase-like domain at N-terminus
MFSQLKSSIIRYGFPVIYLTLNPGEKHSPLALHYAGELIDFTAFSPEHHPLQHRIQVMLQNPLAVVQYFHTTIRAIIDKLLKGGLFGTLTHHYGTIEYQGRGTPHIHMLVRVLSLLSQRSLTLIAMDWGYNFSRRTPCQGACRSRFQRTSPRIHHDRRFRVPPTGIR